MFPNLPSMSRIVQNDNDRSVVMETLTTDEKGYLNKILAPDNLEAFRPAVTSLVKNNNYRVGDFKRLWGLNENIRVISSFFQFMDLVQVPVERRKYTELALGFSVDYKQFEYDSLVQTFLYESLISLTRGDVATPSLQDLNYFLPFKKGIDAVIYPDTYDRMRQFSHVSFGWREPAISLSKEQALNKILDEISQIFITPEHACHYLKKLEDKIQSLAVKTGIASLPHDKFEWRRNMSLFYPVPKTDFVPVKQNHLLSRALLALLEEFGVGHVQLTLFSLVGKDTMSEVISRGYYFSECTLDHSMLLHGKISHMIQIVLICELIKSGRLCTQYEGNKQISILDVFNRLLQPLNARSKLIAWDDLVDNTRSFDYAQGFQNPYILNSYLMTDGERLGLTRLSSSMKMSFLKHFGKCRDFYAEVFQENKLSTDDLWNIICLTQSATLLPCIERITVAHYLKNKTDDAHVYEGDIGASLESATSSPYFLIKKNTRHASQDLPLSGTLLKEYRASVMKGISK